MLPIVNENTVNEVVNDVMYDIHAWRKKMIHYIKDENPEINSAIIEIAQKSDLDPKAVATGAYVAYLLLKKASNDDNKIISFEE